jgi:hypothetical protein
MPIFPDVLSSESRFVDPRFQKRVFGKRTVCFFDTSLILQEVAHFFAIFLSRFVVPSPPRYAQFVLLKPD